MTGGTSRVPQLTAAGRRAPVAFAVSGLLIVGLMAFALVNAGRSRVELAHVDEAQVWLQSVNATVRAVLQAEASQRGYIIAGAPSFREDWRGAVAEVARRVAELDALARAHPERGPSAAGLADLVGTRMRQLDSALAAYDEDSFDAARDLIASLKGKQTMDEIRRAEQALVTAELARLRERRERLTATSRLLAWFLGSGTAATFALLAFTWFSLRRELGARARLAAGLEATSRELTGLNRLGLSLQSCQDIEELDPVIRHYLPQLFPGSHGHLYIARDARNALAVAAGWGDAPASGGTERLHPQECWALRQGTTYEVGGSNGSLPCAHTATVPAGGVLCVPLMARGESLGMISFAFDTPPVDAGARADRLHQAETAALAVGAMVSNLLLREALRAQSVRDPLTGIHNRRFLEETMEREHIRSHRAGTPYSIVMVDLDHFKPINDDYGHPAGDATLQEFARLLAQNVRGADIACRYGGEEFTLVLPGATAEQAAARVERIRALLPEMEVEFGGRALPRLTASFGVSAYPDHGDDWRDVLARADHALYAAKRGGRDRVVIAAPPEPAAS